MALGLDKYTSNDRLDKIRIGDKHINLIGYIDEIHSDMNQQKFKTYKIIVNNNNGKRVLIVAWNENLPIISNVRQLEAVVYAQNLEAIAPQYFINNLGNVDYVLMCSSNSIVNTYGIHGSIRKLISTTIPAAVKYTGCRIRVEGFIQCKFEKKNKYRMKYYKGAITDGCWKLDAIIVSCEKFHMQIGQAVAAVGIMSCNKTKSPRIFINGLEGIAPLEKDEMSTEQILQAKKYPSYNDVIM